MLNKKGLGIHWDIAILALLISIGILMYYTSTLNIPKIGEFSINAIKDLENGNNIPITIDIIMKETGKKTTAEFDANPVFGLNTYCYNPLNIPPPEITPILVTDDELPKPTAYRDALRAGDKTFSPPPWLSTRNPVKCFVEAEELGRYYWEAFDNNYRDFKSKTFRKEINGNFNLDFSNINYYRYYDYFEYAVYRDDNKFFMEAKADNKLEIPIKATKDRTEKQIGKFYLNPSFKIDTNYSFDEATIYSTPTGEYSIPSKEVCVLSKDCGAVCQDVVEWAKIAYTPPKDYKIKKSPCDQYYRCWEAPDAIDDFMNYYPCQDAYPIGNINYLCEGECLPYCSAKNLVPGIIVDTNEEQIEVDGKTAIIDTNTNTECTEFSCDNYVSCGALSSPAACGCPIPLVPQTNTCQGSDCINLDCKKDAEYEAITGISTTCKERSCGVYGYCSDASSCQMYPFQADPFYGTCPVGKKSCICSSPSEPNACEGVLTSTEPRLCWCDEYTGCRNCGDKKETYYDPPGCKDDFCAGYCSTDCDPCCGDPCCGSSDPCCGSTDPCCVNPSDPLCGSGGVPPSGGGGGGSGGGTY